MSWWASFATAPLSHSPPHSAARQMSARDSDEEPIEARPVKRAHIPKPDGQQRPIGVTTTEDKTVQRAAVKVMNAIYETEFAGFSYGFRPGRNQHQALDALHVGICRKRIGWVLDADIRGFFDAIDHEWLMKFIEHRKRTGGHREIGVPTGTARMVTLIVRW